MSTTSPQRPQLNSPITFGPPSSASTHRRPPSGASTDDDDHDFDSEHSSTPIAANRQSPYATRRGAATPTNQLSPHTNLSTPTNATSANSHHGLRPNLTEHPAISVRQQQVGSQSHGPNDQKPNGAWQPGHRPRQHSQGFFEPSLPSANPTTTTTHPQTSNTMASGLTTSQLAAQAAMHAQNAQQHSRKRSQTLPDPAQQPGGGQTIPTRYQLQTERSYNAMPSGQNLRSIDGFLGGHSLAAATAAQAAVYPRTPQYSPVAAPDRAPPPVPEKDLKPSKEKSKIKLAFSKSIGIHKDKGDIDRRFPALPSPGKMSMYSASSLKLGNASTTSLVDPTMSSAASIYSNANSSTSTLVPTDRTVEKEKHKHHFLSRQKNKLWGQDDSHLPLSSASSISKPIDPNAPQPLLYSFAPSSPANPSAFAKGMSGLDLRHGGRALREKKKDEKAPSSLSTTTFPDAPIWESQGSFASSEWPISSALGSSSSIQNGSSSTLPADLAFTPAEVANLGATFGVPGITPDDAWPLLKARLLHIFEGEDPRPPIESFNALVSVHLRRCIQRRAPTVVIEDLNELLQTGFGSLNQTLKSVPDERLVPHVVAMWSLVFRTILPFMQAVFLPLDLEFKGHGPIMSAREAADFWGVALPDTDLGADVNAKNVPTLGEDLDVRRMVILTFRDTIFLPRFEALMAIFSRLSLESVNAGVPSPRIDQGSPLPAPPPIPNSRPGTASSNDIALNSLTSPASYPSSSGAALDSSNGASPFSLLSSAGRSRATSNTSAGSWHSGPSYGMPGHLTPLQPSVSTSSTPQASFPNGFAALQQPSLQPSHNAFALYTQQQSILDTGARLTEMVGRMLQCVSVLSSVQSGDDKQEMMEQLTKTLKWNWLGRGRTGRQRRGFVGTKLRTGTTGSSAPGDVAKDVEVRV